MFYPTSDAALRQPEHLAAVATLSQRLRVHTQAVYSTVAPANLAQELAALRAPDATARAAGLLRSGAPRPSRISPAARGLRAAARAGGADRRLDGALLAGERAARVAARVTSTMPKRRSNGRCASSNAARHAATVVSRLFDRTRLAHHLADVRQVHLFRRDLVARVFLEQDALAGHELEQP